MPDNIFSDHEGPDPTPDSLTGTDTINLSTGLSGSRELGALFSRLIGRLGRFYTINKASLSFYDSATRRLRVTHIYENRSMKAGLALNFSINKSTMYQVLVQGYPVADNYPEHFSGNIIEKKILLSPGSRSVLIVPLVFEGVRMGLLSLASVNESTFGLYLEGIGEGMVTDFVEKLGGMLNSPVRQV
jgi:transcriptional regulator with GAF, ATPase, and Fis domain